MGKILLFHIVWKEIQVNYTMNLHTLNIRLRLNLYGTFQILRFKQIYFLPKFLYIF